MRGPLFRRYKVNISDSSGLIRTANFVTQRAAAKYIDDWRTYLYHQYANGNLLDPCLYFALKKWNGEKQVFDYVITMGGRHFLEDLYLGRVE